MKRFFLLWCLFTLAAPAGAALPTLSISQVPPASLQFSWPSNFADWQLTSTTNLSATAWQPVTQTPLALGNALVVLLPSTNRGGFFRLQQTNSSSCTFHATPPVITSGASSVLSWCPVAGLTYRVSPGPGIVAGGTLIVSPTVTTIYTLTASNALGVVTNFTPVIVNPCGFASVSNWNATLNFTYTKTATAPGFSFSINRSANVTFHLTQYQGVGGGIFSFDSVTGTVSINDREDDSSSGTLITTTTVGSGPPVPLLSAFLLAINCANGTYNFSAIVAVDAIDTETSQGFTSSSPRTAIAGQVAVLPRSLPPTDNTLSGSGQFPLAGPFTIPTSDYYTPNDDIANDMWTQGAVTDATAGTATISWSFEPAP